MNNYQIDELASELCEMHTAYGLARRVIELENQLAAKEEFKDIEKNIIYNSIIDKRYRLRTTMRDFNSETLLRNFEEYIGQLDTIVEQMEDNCWDSNGRRV